MRSIGQSSPRQSHLMLEGGPLNVGGHFDRSREWLPWTMREALNRVEVPASVVVAATYYSMRQELRDEMPFAAPAPRAAYLPRKIQQR